MITAGPRQGQVIWNEGGRSYGPGAAGSDWRTQRDFWGLGHPRRGLDHATLGRFDHKIASERSTRDDSITHFDLFWSDGAFFARPVTFEKLAPNPILKVDFSKLQATSLHPLILTEDQISADDPDTRDSSDTTKVDASKIELRITNIQGGTLHQRADTGTSTPWTKISPLATHMEFTLAQLRGNLVSLKSSAGMSSVAFKIQVVDEAGHLSDSDPNDGESDADPVAAEILIVSPAKVTAGLRGLLNADGVLTPAEATLTDWLEEATKYGGTLRLVVKLWDKLGGGMFCLCGVGMTQARLGPDGMRRRGSFPWSF